MGSSPTLLRYHFEPARAAPPSPLSDLASALRESLPPGGDVLGRRTPLTAAGLLSVLQGREMHPDPAPRPKASRLRAIDFAGRTLLTVLYDAADRPRLVELGDGSQVNLTWSPRGNLREARTADGRCTAFDHDASGDRVSALYPGNVRFEFSNDERDGRRHVTFPDRSQVVHELDSAGRVVRVAAGAALYTFRWQAGRLLGVRMSMDGVECELATGVGELTVPVRPLAPAPNGDPRTLSPLGVWSFGRDGLIHSMFLPGGQRLESLVHARGYVPGYGHHVWSTGGQELYEFSSEAELESILHADGTRTVFLVLEDPREVAAVGLWGVELLRYDRRGWLRSARSVDGRYRVFDYDRHARLVKVRAESGTTRIAYDRAGRVRRLALPSGLRAELGYAGRPIPSEIRLRRLGPNTLKAISQLAGALWTLRSSAPLERHPLSPRSRP